MKLFAIYIGGEMPGANIEVHDMRFLIAASIEETYAELRNQWWGSAKSLHIDCWAEIDHADGYDISLRSEPYDGSEKLFFVNLGGYVPGEFTEMHRNVFVVAESQAKAKSRAVRSVKGWRDPHRDDIYEAEHAFCLERLISDQRLYLHLVRASTTRELTFTCRYTPIRAKPASFDENHVSATHLAAGLPV
jgi:hypothetical protein